MTNSLPSPTKFNWARFAITFAAGLIAFLAVRYLLHGGL